MITPDVVIPQQRLRYALPDLQLPVARTLDGTLLTRIANHPAIRPWLGGGDGYLDLRDHVADPRNLALVGDSGGFLAINLGVGRYEVHTLFEPGTGPETVLATMRAGLDGIFGATEAETLVTKTAWTNEGAVVLTKRAGFAKLYDHLLSPDDQVPATYWQLRIEQWAIHSGLALNLGAWFHTSLTEAKRHWAVEIPPHADDAVHDHMVGAAILLIAHGYTSKALCLYNHWAASTGYALMQELVGPGTVLDIGDAIVAVYPSSMEVLLCR